MFLSLTRNKEVILINMDRIASIEKAKPNGSKLYVEDQYQGVFYVVDQSIDEITSKLMIRQGKLE